MQTEQRAIEATSTPADTNDEFIQLWGQLSPSRQQTALDILRAFAVLDDQDKADAAQKRQRAIDFLDAWHEQSLAEWEAMNDEERAQAERELEEFKQAMNANRAPGPPLYP